MKIQLQLFFLISFLLCNACRDQGEDCHNSVVFSNNRNFDIYVSEQLCYPDTLCFQNYTGITSNAYTTKVFAKTSNSRTLLLNGDCWESFFRNGKNIPSDTLMIFVFDATILENNEWSIVANNYMVLQRYDLSLQNLKELNWHISYPPTGAMKDMRMYPPYSSH